MSKCALNEYFLNTISRDFLSLVIGDRIGEGCSRSVYTWLPDPTLVLKLEQGAQSFSNIREFELWKLVQNKPIAKWFAPIVSISSCGIWMLQKRTAEVLVSELPAKIPSFFTDLKRTNWGRLGKQIVCHDFANNFVTEGGVSKRMKSAKWWELQS